VMKNVTGYDLSKLMAGSFGTLAVLDEITIKVLPAPEKTRTVLVFGLHDAAAVALLCSAMAQPVEVSGAAHLPEAIAARSSVDYVRNARASVTALRLEGAGPSVEARCKYLRDWSGSASEELHSVNSSALWAELRDVTVLAEPRERIVWRLSVPPSLAASVVAKIAATQAELQYFYDWSGGLVWLSLPPSLDAAAAVVRSAVGNDGNATLIRAPSDMRERARVFQPLAAPLAALSARVKDAFDPTNILNPGRMG